MGTSQDQLGPDTLPNDNVPSYPATAADMQRYADAETALSRVQAPVLVHEDNRHEYLYVACFDGTGNDKNKDPLHETNVARISDQIITRFEQGDHQIAQGYVAGPGTEDGWWRRTTDSISGYTYDARLEQMYDLFIQQAWQWRQADPDAQIRLAGTGFSRGAEQNAGFARLVEERGIQDPAGAVYSYNSHGEITHVQYTRPPLVPPHQIAQAVALFDPVGTGAPEQHYDRRLPPSVLSGMQLIAVDEHRSLFKSDHIIDPGVTDNGRFLGVYVSGAHSDVGGSDIHDGLSTRSGNLAIDYLNALSDTPYLQKQAVHDNPDMNVIHRPEYGSLLYWLTPRVDRLSPYGHHTLEAAENTDWRHFEGDPYNAEPINQTLDAQFERRPVPIGPLPAPNEQLRTEAAAARNALDSRIDQLYQGALTGNHQAMDQAAQDYLQSAQGQAWYQQVQDYTHVLQAQTQAREQQQMMRPQADMALDHAY